MKIKFVSILLLFCFVAPIATTFIVLHLQILQMAREIELDTLLGIDEDDLVLLRFTSEAIKNKLTWKNSREFRYEGEMYDIVKTETKNDTTYYWVWKDHEETKINKTLDRLLSFTLRSNQKKQKRVHVFFKSLYFSKRIAREFRPFRPLIYNSIFITNFYQSKFHSPPVPPPQIG